MKSIIEAAGQVIGVYDNEGRLAGGDKICCSKALIIMKKYVLH
jgi:hypothetical protein